MSLDALDNTYDRLRSTGPEFDGWLSNHGPMAAEALVRHGHADEVPGWLDRYCRRLEQAPATIGPGILAPSRRSGSRRPSSNRSGVVTPLSDDHALPTGTPDRCGSARTTRGSLPDSPPPGLVDELRDRIRPRDVGAVLAPRRRHGPDRRTCDDPSDDAAGRQFLRTPRTSNPRPVGIDLAGIRVNLHETRRGRYWVRTS